MADTPHIIDRTVRSLSIGNEIASQCDRTVQSKKIDAERQVAEPINEIGTSTEGRNQMSAQIQEKAPPQIAEDNAKRRQIIEGARAAFHEQGFDAASMNDIARAAGVSKGTLYVYFQNKEQLFQAICSEECLSQAEGLFNFDPNDSDVEATLNRIGIEFVSMVCRPEKASSARTVIAIAERMPEIGRAYYETGPARGIALLSDYLKTKVQQGILAIDDCEVVAAQLIEALLAPLFKPILFNFGRPPTQERIRYVVGIAVRAFLAAYKVPNSTARGV